MPDAKIDFSAIPESSDAELARAKRVGRPATGRAKRLIAIRIDPGCSRGFGSSRVGGGSPTSQTLIHELLEKAAGRAA